jgi:hypothetical protein
MPGHILQLNFQFHTTPAMYERAMASLTEAIAAVPGLRWAVWLINREKRLAGCLHLFADEPSLEAYRRGPIIGGLSSHPLLSQFSVHQFEVLEWVTSVTRGPIHPGTDWQHLEWQ